MIQLENPKESYTVHFQTYKITITKQFTTGERENIQIKGRK